MAELVQKLIQVVQPTKNKTILIYIRFKGFLIIFIFKDLCNMDLDTWVQMHYCNFHTIFVKRVAQARHARSGVAGLFSWNGPVRPASFRAAVTASLIAKNTELPRNNVGSPIPYNKRDIAPQSEGFSLQWYHTWTGSRKVTTKNW